MNFSSLFHEKYAQLILQHPTPESVISLMGYPKKQTEKSVAHLALVLRSYHLGLDSDLLDLRYSNVDFLVKLTSLMGIPTEETQAAIKLLVKDVIRANYFEYAACIRVSAHIKQTNISFFSRGKVNPNFFHLSIGKRWRNKTLPEKITDAQKLIIKHYDDHQKAFAVLGGIKDYTFYYDEHLPPLIFDTKGDLITEIQSN